MSRSPLTSFILLPEKRNVNSVPISGDRREWKRASEQREVRHDFITFCIETSVNRINRRWIGKAHYWHSLNVSNRSRKRQEPLRRVRLIIATVLSVDRLVSDGGHAVQISEFSLPEFPIPLIRIFQNIRSLIAVTGEKDDPRIVGHLDGLGADR